MGKSETGMVCTFGDSSLIGRYTSNLFVLGVLAYASVAPAEVTLQSFGAKGDGVTDDRAAIERALIQSNGTQVDGEGLTYVVNGTISIPNAVDFRNATLKQIMPSVDTSAFIQSHKTTSNPIKLSPPDSLKRMVDGQPLFTAAATAVYAEDPILNSSELEGVNKMLNVRTLSINGSPSEPVSVNLQKIKVQRGNNPDAGMHSCSAGLYIVNCKPVKLVDVEISGDGKGSGLFISKCDNVQMDRVNIHDIKWAPYKGDIDWTVAQLGGKDFGWNNTPIYDFSPDDRRFVRVRVQEQVTGMSIFECNNVEISNSRIDRIGTMVEGKFYPWQADGMTVNAVKNITIKDCAISEVWEGIDFTGEGVDGFLQDNISVSDVFAYGLKYAHPIKNGRVVNCKVDGAGLHGYTISSEGSNITFEQCVARETGKTQYWWRNGKPAGNSGFYLDARNGELPRDITIKDCSAINSKYPGTMSHGFSTPAIATAPELHNVLINPKVSGASEAPINNFPH